MANPNPNAIGIPNPNPRPSVQPPPALPSTFKQEYIANPIYSEAAKKGDISTLQVLVDAGDVNAVLTIVSSVLGQGVLSCQHPRAQLHRVPCVGCFIVCTDTTLLTYFPPRNAVASDCHPPEFGRRPDAVYRMAAFARCVSGGCRH